MKVGRLYTSISLFSGYSHTYTCMRVRVRDYSHGECRARHTHIETCQCIRVFVVGLSTDTRSIYTLVKVHVINRKIVSMHVRVCVCVCPYSSCCVIMMMMDIACRCYTLRSHQVILAKQKMMKSYSIFQIDVRPRTIVFFAH